jgi:protein TonB
MSTIRNLPRPPAPPRAPAAALAALSFVMACLAPATQAQDTPAGPAAETLAFDPNSCTRPAWPKASLRNHEEGVVEASFLVGTDGQVKEARILRTAGFRDLDKAVLDAYRVCRTTTLPARATWVPVRHAWSTRGVELPPKAAPAAGQAL